MFLGKDISEAGLLGEADQTGHGAREWFAPGAGAARDSSFQVQLQARGRGRKTEGHSPSLLSQLPGESSREVTSLHGEGFPKVVCSSKTGRRKGPREEEYRNSSAVSHSPRGRSSVLCIPLYLQGQDPGEASDYQHGYHERLGKTGPKRK